MVPTMRQKTISPILIVGAGATGLMLGITLARAGVPFRLIDKAKERKKESSLITLQCRTLELFDAFGIVDEFLEKGHRIHGIQFHEGAATLGSIDFDRLKSFYPCAINLPQASIEDILEKELLRLGGCVEWSAELLGLRMKKDSVYCKVQDAQELIEQIDYRFVAGCDGIDSPVRHCLGVEYDETSPEFLGIAEVKLQSSLPENRATVYLHDEGFVLFQPIRSGEFRILAQLSDQAAASQFLLEDLQELIAKRVGAGVHVPEARHLAGYHSRDGLAERFSLGNAFLLGDAAHHFRVASGQALNAGIQDAINLGWKLASVVQGHSPKSLLRSYEAERLPAAEFLLQNARDLMANPPPLVFEPESYGWLDAFRRFLQGPQPREHEQARDIGQVSLNYTQGPLTKELRRKFYTQQQMRAGERLPDVEFIGVGGVRKRLYDEVKAPGFHLFLAPKNTLRFGPSSYGDARFLADHLQNDFHGLLHIHWLLTPRQSFDLATEVPVHYVDLGGNASHALGISPCGMALVRPDYYSSLASHTFDLGTVRLSLLSYWI